MTLFMTLIYLPDSEIKQNCHANDVKCGSCISAITDGIVAGV